METQLSCVQHYEAPTLGGSDCIVTAMLTQGCEPIDQNIPWTCQAVIPDDMINWQRILSADHHGVSPKQGSCQLNSHGVACYADLSVGNCWFTNMSNAQATSSRSSRVFSCCIDPWIVHRHACKLDAWRAYDDGGYRARVFCIHTLSLLRTQNKKGKQREKVWRSTCP